MSAVSSEVVKITSKAEEFDFLVKLLGTDGFHFMPECGEPTVRMRDFFVSDKDGKIVGLEDGTGGAIFLNGTVIPWGRLGPSFDVSGIRVTKWLIFFPIRNY